MNIYHKKFSNYDIAEKFAGHDIADDMEKGLIKSAMKEKNTEDLQVELFHSLDRIAALAEKYEAAGMEKEAIVLTELLEAYAEGNVEAIKNNLAETKTFGQEDPELATTSELVVDPDDATKVQEMLTFDDEV